MIKRIRSWWQARRQARWIRAMDKFSNGINYREMRRLGERHKAAVAKHGADSKQAREIAGDFTAVLFIHGAMTKMRIAAWNEWERAWQNGLDENGRPRNPAQPAA